MFNKIDDVIKFNNAPKDKIALIYKDKQFTYQELIRKSENMASILAVNRIEGNVVVLLGNRPETIFSIFGISRVGCVFIPANDKIKSNKLKEILNDAQPTAVITDDAHINIFEDTKYEPELLINVDAPQYTYNAPVSVHATLAAIMYTSGSTGKPKGVVCLHKNMIAAIEIINDYLEHTPQDRILTVLPLSHGYGLYQVLAPLAVGATVILEPGVMFIQHTMNRINKMNATGFAAVPSMIQMMLQTSIWKDRLQNLEYLTSAGAGLPPQHFEMLDTELKDTQIIPMYGQTECVRALHYPSHSGITNYKSCGRAMPQTKCTIEDGELVVEGPTVMRGYWNKPEETAKVFRDGKLYTGDLFEQDSQGMFYYIGRRDEIIKIGGERVAPQEVDNVLLALLGVREVAAFAVEDDVWGNRIVVYVACDEEALTKADVMGYCKRNLEAFLMPKDVVIVDKIPKNANGKISRADLKKLYLER